MTGMGDDGAEAIRVVRERGGRTIAESAESAIIFGMPAEAIKTGAVDEVLPLSQIPARAPDDCACDLSCSAEPRNAILCYFSRLLQGPSR